MVDRLTPEDAGILALERGNVRGHTCKLLVVEGQHPPEAIRESLAGRVGSVPRLRQRLVEAPLGLAPPALVEDEDFRIERHVRGGAGPLGDERLRDEVARLMAEPLDRERPLWAMDVLPLEGDRTALVWRLHHAIADGTVAMRMARALLFEEGAAPRAPGSRGPAEAPGLLDALRWRGAATAADAAGAVRAVASPANWVAAARNAARLPAVLRRELARGARSSSLDRPAGPRREVAFMTAPLERVKAIAHGAKERATVNDVVLAAVAGGLRRWLGAIGAEQVAMRVKVPVSLHTRDEAADANLDSFMCVDLPIAAPDAETRLLAVAEETRERKSLHDAQTLAGFFADLSHLSRSLERFAEHWAMSPRVFTLNVSNVPGPAEELRVFGSPLLEMYSLAEIAHRHALRVAVVSAAGSISFGLCADPDAVAGLELIASGIEDELGELAANL
ncbi:MAG: wax ester/triacylglycerol synthase domain-containing protein [Thermoleophilaceae bacterium]